MYVRSTHLQDLDVILQVLLLPGLSSRLEASLFQSHIPPNERKEDTYMC